MVWPVGAGGKVDKHPGAAGQPTEDLGAFAAADPQLHWLKLRLVAFSHEQHPGPAVFGDHSHGGDQGFCLDLAGLEAHIGCHANAQGTGGLQQPEDDIKGGHVVELDGAGCDALDPGREGSVGEGIHPHGGTLAKADSANVAFGNFRHHLQALGQFHDRRAGGSRRGRGRGGGCHEGAWIGIALADHAAERRPHNQFLLFHLASCEALAGRLHRRLIH